MFRYQVSKKSNDNPKVKVHQLQKLYFLSLYQLHL